MRLFILLLAVMAGVGLLGKFMMSDGLIGQHQEAEAQIVSPPNIIFILTDDQAESTLSHMDNI